MEVHVTRHARNRMRLYGIEQEEVEMALASPDQVTAGLFGGRHLWKRRVPGGWLRVTVKDEATRRIVITVTPKQHGPGESHAH